MRRFVVLACVWTMVMGSPIPTQGADDAAAAAAAAVKELAIQLREMREELSSLRQENERLKHAVQQQAATHRSSGSYNEPPPTLFPDQPVRIFQTPGVPPPSWLDLLIESNRQKTMEALAQARANERLVDERLARIAAESRAVGAAYCPRPLRETALAGGDVKTHRDRLVSARSSDFDALFNRVEVKEYLKVKVALLSSDDGASKGGNGTYNGSIAPANVRILADRLRRDFEDTTILFGAAGLHGHAPAGMLVAQELTRRMRDSSNPQVSGPTRDTIAQGRRAAAVDEAVANDVDVELVLRMKQIREANRQLQGGDAPVYTARDIEHLNNVLSGRVSRTAIPQVHALEGIMPPQN